MEASVAESKIIVLRILFIEDCQRETVEIFIISVNGMPDMLSSYVELAKVCLPEKARILSVRHSNALDAAAQELITKIGNAEQAQALLREIVSGFRDLQMSPPIRE